MSQKTKRKFYRLGEKASSYYDPGTKLQLAPNKPGFLDKISDEITKAARSGHIREISEVEYADMLKRKEELEANAGKPVELPKPSTKELDELNEDLNLKTVAELKEQAAGLPGITDAEIKKASKLNKADLITFIEDWEEPKEEDDDEDED